MGERVETGAPLMCGTAEGFGVCARAAREASMGMAVPNIHTNISQAHSSRDAGRCGVVDVVVADDLARAAIVEVYAAVGRLLDEALREGAPVAGRERERVRKRWAKHLRTHRMALRPSIPGDA